MKKVTALVLCFSTFISFTASAVPRDVEIAYQGEVTFRDDLIDGSGFFKFTIVDENGGTLWSSDDSVEIGDVSAEPTDSIEVDVVDGRFSVILGGSLMSGISAEVFNTDEERRLCVWFSDDSGSFEALTPCQKFMDTPFAAAALLALDLEVTSVTSSGDISSEGDITTSGDITASDGTASLGEIVLSGSSSDTVTAGRIYYDSEEEVFVACNSTSCEQLSQGGAGSVSDDSVSSDSIVADTIVAGDIATGGVGTAEILDNTVSSTDLSATLTFSDADLIDLSAILHDDATAQGLRLPNVGAAPTDITGATEGYLAYDETNDNLVLNTGTTWVSLPSSGNHLGFFGATTSAQLAGIISDETGSGLLTFATAPTFTTSITVGSDGVSLTDSGDGVLTLTGVGSGTDEVLSLDLNSANVGTFSSTSGLVTLNFSSIALQESGVGLLNNDEIDGSAELAAIMDDETGTGVLTFATAPTFTTNISVGSAGVRFTDDGDGAITFLGLGDGNDEDLTLNLDDVSNVGTFTSSTGLATLNFSGIALQDSGGVVLSNDDIDGSSELAAIMDDETGSGLLTFATAPTFTTSISIGSAGVRLSDDGDGALTFLSLGNGSGGLEDLTLNLDDTSNVGTFTSSTSLATLNFSGIALQESGVGLLNNDEIDGSTELAGIMDDETGSGVLTFATAPTFTTNISIGSAGVRLSDDGDGALTFLSLGNGSGGLEDLTLNLDDTSNVGTFTSSTSLATLNFSGIALQESSVGLLNNDEIDGSAELAAIMDDETGSGALVFANTPTLVTPALGAATATSVAIGGGTAITKITVGSVADGASGWVPDGATSDFTITAGAASVTANSVITVSVGVNATAAACGVYDQDASTSFKIKCSANIDDNATLQYMIVN